jgi:hypothetical protein
MSFNIGYKPVLAEGYLNLSAFPLAQIHLSFLSVLGAFEGRRKATAVSFVMSVHPSSWNNSAPAGRVFLKFDI